MNRALLKEAGPLSPLRAVGLGPTLPRSLRGPQRCGRHEQSERFSDPRCAWFAPAFETMYASTVDTVLHGTGRETFDAIKIMQSIQKQTYVPAEWRAVSGRRASGRACSRSRARSKPT